MATTESPLRTLLRVRLNTSKESFVDQLFQFLSSLMQLLLFLLCLFDYGVKLLTLGIKVILALRSLIGEGVHLLFHCFGALELLLPAFRSPLPPSLVFHFFGEHVVLTIVTYRVKLLLVLPR